MRSRKNPVTGRRARGFTLIEVMVALVVFSLGVLGLVGLQGGAVRFSSDARQRADATFLADQLMARALISDPTTIAGFAHKPTGTTACAPTGAASTNLTVTAWLAEVADLLPNADAAKHQIVVGPGAGQLTVRLCWQNGDDTPHQLVVSNVVQW